MNRSSNRSSLGFRTARRPHLKHVAGVLFLGATVLGSPRAAHATPNFPAAIRGHLGASAEPSCQVCHNGATRTGTVTRAFGAAMLQRGLKPFDDNSLRSALDRMKADAVDSDSDGTLDVDALRNGADPNVGAAGGGVDTTPRPEYGCIGSVSPHAKSSRLGWLSFLAPMALVAAARMGRSWLRSRVAKRSATR